MPYSRPATEIMRQRFSCRTYLDKPIEPAKQQALEKYLVGCTVGPFGASNRFKLAAATEQDRRALRGLGTYGFIKGAAGFVIGAVKQGHKNLEDFGYLMEQIILFATDIGLGTCWLGGTFSKGSFAHKMALDTDELVPAVATVGYISGQPRMVDSLIRRGARSDSRYGWERLFFDKQFGEPLEQKRAGEYAVPLEMVRLGPSASNRQPWRMIREGSLWHFYLRRSRGYGQGLSGKLMAADLQRVDMGIAMCHFELAARELGLQGQWVIQEPCIEKPELTEYSVTWNSM